MDELSKKHMLMDFVQAYLPMNDDQRREFNALLSTDDRYAGVRAENVTMYEQGLKKGELSGLIAGLLCSAEVKFGRDVPEMSGHINALPTPDAARQAMTFLRQAATPEEFMQELSRL